MEVCLLSVETNSWRPLSRSRFTTECAGRHGLFHFVNVLRTRRVSDSLTLLAGDAGLRSVLVETFDDSGSSPRALFWGCFVQEEDGRFGVDEQSCLI